jgi:hypothetical protein
MQAYSFLSDLIAASCIILLLDIRNVINSNAGRISPTAIALLGFLEIFLLTVAIWFLQNHEKIGGFWKTFVQAS